MQSKTVCIGEKMPPRLSTNRNSRSARRFTSTKKIQDVEPQFEILDLPLEIQAVELSLSKGKIYMSTTSARRFQVSHPFAIKRTSPLTTAAAASYTQRPARSAAQSKEEASAIWPTTTWHAPLGPHINNIGRMRGVLPVRGPLARSADHGARRTPKPGAWPRPHQRHR